MHAVAKKASVLSERSELSEELRIVWNTFVYGTIYTEYVSLGFYERSHQMKKTYATTFRLLETLQKYNSRDNIQDFHNKIRFNSLFKKYINREYLDLSKASEDEVQGFIRTHDTIVLKNSWARLANRLKYSPAPTPHCCMRYLPVLLI